MAGMQMCARRLCWEGRESKLGCALWTLWRRYCWQKLRRRGRVKEERRKEGERGRKQRGGQGVGEEQRRTSAARPRESRQERVR